MKKAARSYEVSFFLNYSYGWFFQNLGKEAVRTFMHTTVATMFVNRSLKGFKFKISRNSLVVGACMLLAALHAVRRESLGCRPVGGAENLEWAKYQCAPRPPHTYVFWLLRSIFECYVNFHKDKQTRCQMKAYIMHIRDLAII